MKIDRFFTLVLALLSLYGVAALFQAPFFDSHDGAFHLIRLHQFHRALTNGQFPVRWAPTLFSGLGYPLFVVNYSFPYYLAELFHLSGLGLYDSFKTVMILTFVISAIAMYQLLRKHFSPWASLVGAILFTFAPYRFANIFTRGALGESVALTFVPLAFWSTHFLKGSWLKSIAFTTLGFSLLLSSHPAVFLIFFPIIIAYVLIVLGRSRALILKLFTISLLTAIVTAYQLLPSLFERSFMQFDAKLLSFYRSHFLEFLPMLRIHSRGELLWTPFQIGITQVVVLFLASLLWIKRRSNLTAYFLFLSYLAIFLQTKFSLKIWEVVPVLPYILYPWRFLALVILAISFLGSWLMDLQKKYRYILGTLLIIASLFTTRHFRQITRVLDFPEVRFATDIDTGTTENEFLPIGISESIRQFAAPSVEFVAGSGEVLSLVKSAFSWKVDVLASSPSFIKMSILAFPGWQVELDGKVIPFNAQYGEYSGLIVVFAPTGKHRININFQETPLRQLSNYLSFIGMLIVVSASLKIAYNYRKRLP